MKRIVLLVFAVLLPAQLNAQIPDKFENLQVLPKDIARDSLLTIMRSFSFALGVRCVYCHVGEDNPTLAGVDFKSDERSAKKKAREMIRMVGTVNDALAKLPDRTDPINVRCMTCHRGFRRPITLEDSLYKVVAARGGSGAVAMYDSLRTAFVDRAVFDFSSMPLVRLAERLYAEKRHEDAIALLRKNVERHPQFWNSYWELGRHLEALDRKAEAIAAYRAVLERLPNHQGSAARLRALTNDGP